MALRSESGPRSVEPLLSVAGADATSGSTGGVDGPGRRDRAPVLAFVSRFPRRVDDRGLQVGDVADREAGRAPNALGAMQIVVRPDRHGGGLSGTMVEAMKAAARSAGKKC